MLVPHAKPPLTFDQQLDLLASRGLVIADRPAAAVTLSRISYYRLSACCLPFKVEHEHFRPGSTWEQVIDLSEFDRRLRILVTDALERVEVALRTAITYNLAHAYGAFAHCSPAHFRPEFGHAGWNVRLDEEAAKSRETFIEHFRAKYDGFPRLPIWMASEVMSFGLLSRLFEGMVDHDQQKIGTLCSLPHLVLRSWLRTLTFVRNVCAHHAACGIGNWPMRH